MTDKAREYLAKAQRVGRTKCWATKIRRLEPPSRAEDPSREKRSQLLKSSDQKSPNVTRQTTKERTREPRGG